MRLHVLVTSFEISLCVCDRSKNMAQSVLRSTYIMTMSSLRTLLEIILGRKSETRLCFHLVFLSRVGKGEPLLCSDSVVCDRNILR